MNHLEKISEYTGFRLGEANRLLRELYSQRLAALGVKPSQIYALGVLSDQKLSMPSELATALGVSRPSMTTLLDRMVRDELIQRVTDQGNRRRIWIVPLPKGLELLAEAHNILQEIENVLEKKLGFDMAEFREQLKILSVDTSARLKTSNRAE
ncbi:MAG: hypothetical protein COB37_01920 [Kordiimonadales bacterium]|nr:MAG: hypothetical protein COB37_01920 [Kordiimonadales bacterium]